MKGIPTQKRDLAAEAKRLDIPEWCDASVVLDKNEVKWLLALLHRGPIGEAPRRGLPRPA